MIEAVVKVGGSLSLQKETLNSLCMSLALFSQKHSLVVVPGGGEFADAVRRVDEQFSLSCEVTHRMAILGMDQYGLLLSDLTPNSVNVTSLDEITDALHKGNLPIILPAHLMFTNNPLANSWDITSDSIAAYFAVQLRSSKVLLVKDVDGIYTSDPKKEPNAQLLPALLANQLARWSKSAGVDKYLPNLLLENRLDCYVVNGLVPERVQAILDGQQTICTLIKGI